MLETPLLLRVQRRPPGVSVQVESLSGSQGSQGVQGSGSQGLTLWRGYIVLAFWRSSFFIGSAFNGYFPRLSLALSLSQFAAYCRRDSSTPYSFNPAAYCHHFSSSTTRR